MLPLHSGFFETQGQGTLPVGEMLPAGCPFLAGWASEDGPGNSSPQSPKPGPFLLLDVHGGRESMDHAWIVALGVGLAMAIGLILDLLLHPEVVGGM